MPSAYDLYTFYIDAADLRGKTVTVTVAAADVEEVFNPRIKRTERRLVISFAGKKKALPLNKTQAAAMIEATKTDDYTRWPGAVVQLTATRASNGRDTITITPAPAGAGTGEVSETEAEA